MQPSSHIEVCNLLVNHVKTIDFKIYGLHIYLWIWIHVYVPPLIYISTYTDREVNVSQNSKATKISEVLPCLSSPITTEILTKFVLLPQQCFCDKRRGNRQRKKDKWVEERGPDPAFLKTIHQSTASSVGLTHKLPGVVIECAIIIIIIKKVTEDNILQIISGDYIWSFYLIKSPQT